MAMSLQSWEESRADIASGAKKKNAHFGDVLLLGR